MPIQPRVCIVIAAYDAHDTIEHCLESLRAQTYRDFEVILVDSSPGEETARIAERFPEVRFVRSATRLYAHEARNRAVAIARGELIVCLDADVYAHPDWLERMVAAYDASGQVIVGAIGCHGRRLRELGMHFCKFAKFLPAGESRAIDSGPTANLLVSRADFDRVGGLSGGPYLADVGFGRALEALGRELRFEPPAIGAHHHTQSFRAFLGERFVRGRLFGEMRASWLASRWKIAFYLAVSALPVRLARIAGLTWRYCAAARMTGWFLLTWPIALAGHAAWLAGESIAYAERVLALRPSARKNGAAVARTSR